MTDIPPIPGTPTRPAALPAAGTREEPSLTDRWHAVLERFLGQGTPASQGGTSAPVRPHGHGELGILMTSSGHRLLDRTRFSLDLPPAGAEGEVTAASATDRRRAEAVAAFADQIAMATSDAERRFEERQLQLTLARLDGTAPPATAAETQQVLARRAAFRAESGPPLGELLDRLR